MTSKKPTPRERLVALAQLVGILLCVVAVAVWAVFFPAVEQHYENGRCIQTTTYAAIITQVEPC